MGLYIALIFICSIALNSISISAEQSAGVKPPNRENIPPQQSANAARPQGDSQEKAKKAATNAAREQQEKADEKKYQRETNERNIKIQEKMATFTGYLVIFSGFQVGVAMLSLGGIWVAWKAAKAADASAKAASREADLIKSLERPWLVVTPNRVKPRKVIRAIEQSGIVTIDFVVKNVGNGPAFLVEQFAILVRKSYPIPENEQPDYSDAKPLPKMVIAPNDNHSQRSNPLIVIDQRARQDVADGKNCIVFYGRVSYYDTLHDTLHTTRFCSYWYVQKNSKGETIAYGYCPNGHFNFIEYT